MKFFKSKLSIVIAASTLMALTIGSLKMEVPEFYRHSGSEEHDNMAREEEANESSAAGYLQWRHERLANQVTGQVDYQDVMNADKAIAAMQSAGMNKTNAGMEWIELGPDNVGGRTRSILVDRNNNKVIYAGSVSGGIWKSTTSGSSWSRVNDLMSTLNICSMTQTKDGAIYAGTGEDAFVSVTGSTNVSPGFAGAGIFKSTDGTNFTQLPSTTAAMWANVSDMVADPLVDSKVYAGNTTSLYISTDGGSSWTKASGAGSGTCKDISISSDGSVIAAVIGINVYYSTDHGASFNKATIPWGGSPGRISISVAPSNSSYIYAMASNAGNERLLSVVRSKDKGANWEVIAVGSTPYNDILGSSLQGQGYWNNVTSVDPENENHVYLGGIDIWDWNPGVGLKPLSVWYYATTSPLFVHADNHVIVWDTKTSPATMYIGNDGGIFKSKDKGKSFYHSNKGYDVTQFYGVSAAFDQTKESWVVVGGSQDNGTWLIDGSGNTALSGEDVNGGDGFSAAVSQKIPGFAIYSTYDSDLESARNYYRRDNDPAAKYDQTFYNDRISAYCKDSGQFNTPFRLWETTTADSVSEFVMAARGAAWIAKDIYKDLSKVPVWYRLTNFSGSASCLDISTDGNTVVLGTVGGLVYRIDGLRTASYDSANALVGGLSVSLVHNSGGQAINGVTFSQTNKNKVVICRGNYGNIDYVLLSSNFMSVTPTFSSIQGNLPKIPTYEAQINMEDSSMLIVGTEKGIFVSHNFLSGSPVYTAENTGMANVPVFQVRQYKNPSPWHKFEGPHFFIGTHGRGFFASNTYARVGLTNHGKDVSKLNIYPNPASVETTLSFISKGSSKAQIRIFNLQGQLVKQDEINTTSGRNNYGFYIDGLANGNYIAVVEHDGTRETAKLVVTK
jgi:hypothetical protein